MFKKRKENIIAVRFLVPSNQIGCILGKDGSIISKMRKRTRENIRIMLKGNLPKCATENDELAQIVGEFDVVREALVQIASRIRAHIIKDKDGGASLGSIVLGFLSFLNMPSGVPTSGFGGWQDLGSPSGMYSLSGLDLKGITGGKLSSGYGNY